MAKTKSTGTSFFTGLSISMVLTATIAILTPTVAHSPQASLSQSVSYSSGVFAD